MASNNINDGAKHKSIADIDNIIGNVAFDSINHVEGVDHQVILDNVDTDDGFTVNEGTYADTVECIVGAFGFLFRSFVFSRCLRWSA